MGETCYRNRNHERAWFSSIGGKHVSARLLQAGGDYVGAHTYERMDQPHATFFHLDGSTTRIARNNKSRLPARLIGDLTAIGEMYASSQARHDD
jgi:hypothetical protein